MCFTNEGGRPQKLITVDRAQFKAAYATFLKALTDYSTDQRGDIGSWIRIAGLTALSRAIATAVTLPGTHDWVSQRDFDAAIDGIVKLGVEKLEPVRAASWRAWRRLKAAQAVQCWHWESKNVWTFEVQDERSVSAVLPGSALMRSDESFRYIGLKSWYLSAMPVLDTKQETALISGLSNSIGSQVQTVVS